MIDADGTLLGRYRKMHIPDDPLYYEKFYFTPGDTGFPGMADALRPDRRADLLGPMVSRGGAPDRPAGGGDSFLSDGHRLAPGGEEPAGCATSMRRGKPSSGPMPWPTAATWRPSTASAANGRQAVAGIEFWGQSFVAGTSGEMLARAGADEEEVLLATVDLAEVDATRTHWPFLRDRRIDAYGDLTKRFRD